MCAVTHVLRCNVHITISGVIHKLQSLKRHQGTRPNSNRITTRSRFCYNDHLPVKTISVTTTISDSQKSYPTYSIEINPLWSVNPRSALMKQCDTHDTLSPVIQLNQAMCFLHAKSVMLIPLISRHPSLCVIINAGKVGVQSGISDAWR